MSPTSTASPSLHGSNDGSFRSQSSGKQVSKDLHDAWLKSSLPLDAIPLETLSEGRESSQTKRGQTPEELLEEFDWATTELGPVRTTALTMTSEDRD